MPVEAPAQRRRRNTIVPGGRRGSVSVFDGQLRVELSTLHKKYDRLETKEKRIQVKFSSHKLKNYRLQFNLFSCWTLIRSLLLNVLTRTFFETQLTKTIHFLIDKKY